MFRLRDFLKGNPPFHSIILIPTYPPPLENILVKHLPFILLQADIDIIALIIIDKYFIFLKKLFNILFII